MSDIRVFVAFPESNAVFAGETLECKITFKNTAQKPSTRGPPSSSQLSSPSSNGYTIGGPRGPLAPPLYARPERTSPRPASARPPSAGPKQTTQHASSTAKSPVIPFQQSIVPNGRPNQIQKHQRSISIVSLGSDKGSECGGRGPGTRDGTLRSPPPQQRPRGHGRSASLQITTGRQSSVTNGSFPSSGALFGRAPHSPPNPAAHSAMGGFSFPARAAPSVPATPISPGAHERSKSVNRAFEFPPTPSSSGAGDLVSIHLNGGAPPADLKGPLDDEQLQSARIIPAQSVCGETPRSSGEFYSMSNSTTETLLSEYDPKGQSRLLRPHNRRHSLLSIGPKVSETLMMGYAHVIGSFTLDGSLIQTSLFEDVKRRGVLGTQSGGGVVGLESSKNDGGFLSGLGWGGLGGLLGGGGMSSIAEMKNTASTRSVPILSTPQSILFVDLRLPPGESRSYKFKFTLPKGIPPSHKGKAIKIAYNLVLGTQRPGKGVVQPTIIEVPFRVLPYVNGNGTLNTHDLMSPVVLLRDEAKSECLDESRLPTPFVSPLKQGGKQESSLDDFLSYVDDLLAPPASGYNTAGSLGLLSPSFAPSKKRLSVYEDLPSTPKDAVEMALTGGQGPSPCSIFEIARNGYRVAAISIARPAYKLGESPMVIIDFTGAKIPCYHIHASLESSEKVEPSLALRSASSIHRATRKIYARHSESTLFANRIVFTPTIPVSATPEFHTSGISNSWFLRFEFITSAVSLRVPTQSDNLVDDLLEQTYADDRGELYEPRQGIFVESFDASVPIKIYPNGADPGTAGSVIGVQTSAAATVGFPV